MQASNGYNNYDNTINDNSNKNNIIIATIVIYREQHNYVNHGVIGIFQTSPNWLGAFESSCCPSSLTSAVVDLDL